MWGPHEWGPFPKTAAHSEEENIERIPVLGEQGVQGLSMLLA